MNLGAEKSVGYKIFISPSHRHPNPSFTFSKVMNENTEITAKRLMYQKLLSFQYGKSLSEQTERKNLQMKGTE